MHSTIVMVRNMYRVNVGVFQTVQSGVSIGVFLTVQSGFNVCIFQTFQWGLFPTIHWSFEVWTLLCHNQANHLFSCLPFFFTVILKSIFHKNFMKRKQMHETGMEAYSSIPCPYQLESWIVHFPTKLSWSVNLLHAYEDKRFVPSCNHSRTLLMLHCHASHICVISQLLLLQQIDDRI